MIRLFFVLNVLLSFSFFIFQAWWLAFFIVLQIVIVLFSLKYEFRYFAHSLFWPLFSVSLLYLPWPLSFIVPVVLYIFLIFMSDAILKETGWLSWGTINRNTLVLMVAVIILSSSALILWVVLLKPDLADLKNMVPVDSVYKIIIIGLLFSVFNSIWEEIILKGILWSGLELTFSNVLMINVFQAVLFGVMHYNGFPRGIIGAILAGIYGLLIGFIRKSSNGLAAPVITHFFADATIFGILVYVKL